MYRKVAVSMDDIILRTMQVIKNKYSVSDDIALKYAHMTLNALESHGGSREDFYATLKVVDVVVKSWLESDGYI